MPEERIQKVLAEAGVASRRASEAMVAAGRVRVDGKPATIGQKVDPATASIQVDGQPVGVGTARAYVALHKPVNVTSTTRDRHAETTVLELVPTALVPDGTRIYPVGRLDQDSEGLLLLTNDGDWADRVLHPRFGVLREYALALAVPLTPEQSRTLSAGVQLEEGIARFATPFRSATRAETAALTAVLDPQPEGGLAWYRAVLGQGWKRQLRRMFGAVDAPILRLVRVRIGPIELGKLRSGQARRLTGNEIARVGGDAVAPQERAGRYRSRAAAAARAAAKPGSKSGSKSSKGAKARPSGRPTSGPKPRSGPGPKPGPKPGPTLGA
ncbi:MAG TPA: pseudouridine synthase [Candidatus Limnocylindria bacterium]|nr:pseudouridine synthase [Candidatus Limnocylindria bacterium]